MPATELVRYLGFSNPEDSDDRRGKTTVSAKPRKGVFRTETYFFFQIIVPIENRNLVLFSHERASVKCKLRSVTIRRPS